MTKNKLIKQFINAVNEMKETHDNETYHWNLDVHGNQQWAIVLGWSDGFEEDPNDDCLDGTYRICTKLAHQSVNSMSQCDYDIDWTMPYDIYTDEVDDTEISIYPDTDLESIVNNLLGQYEAYKVLIEADEVDCMTKY